MTMRNDATRLRVPARDTRMFRGVVPRQGQVLLDTDFSQESRALHYRLEEETADVLNSRGKLVYPASEPAFQVTANGGPADFIVSAGHGYLDGWLLQNSAAATLQTQAHPRQGDVLTAPAIIAIKALVRHIDPVEDSNLADRGLGDAQASGRALNDWQVFALNVPGGGPLDCAGAAQDPGWTAVIAPSSGTMSVHKQTATPSTDPCSLTPGGGYTRLENLLYRVEVHGGKPLGGIPDVDGPRFGLDGLVVKFSRRNASIMARIVDVDVARFRVEPAGLDLRAWFAPGTYAEIVNIHDDVDPRAALANERLFQVSVATADSVELKATAAQIAATGVSAAADPSQASWFLRLWDPLPADEGTNTVEAVGADSKMVELGDGLSVQFHDAGNATFRRGDYWTFAARVDGSIEWPVSVANTPEPMVPHGPEVRYATLAIMTADNPPAYENCSVPFGSLTDRLLFYRGGDGQSVFPDPAQAFVSLSGPLRVAVMRGQTPVPGAKIRWSPGAGAPDTEINGQPCSPAQPVITVTDSSGIVEVAWALDRAKLHELHQVTAALMLSPTEDLPNCVEFNASFATAKQTAYEPGQCPHLVNVTNVQDALDTLCANLGQDSPRRTINLSRITLIGGQETQLIDDGLILNGLEVRFDAFMERIRFGLDAKGLELQFDPLDPVVEIILDLPYPCTDADRFYWTVVSGGHGMLTQPFGFQQIRLDGMVITEPGAGESLLEWTPSPAVQAFLRSEPRHWFGQALGPDRPRLEQLGWVNQPRYAKIPCRIRLRSALIWAKDPDTGQPIYLNAEHLGTRATQGARPLLLKEKDPQRAGDLDMFIYLKVHVG